jgi:2'-5' RNA ligase
MTKIRTFVGVEVSSSTRASAYRIVQRLESTGAGYKWVRKDNLHITLNFLGDVDETIVPDVCKAIRQSVSRVPAFRVVSSGLGSFPSRQRPQVVWIGTHDGIESMIELNSRIADGLDDYRFPRENREYQPHLTLGRLRRGGTWNQSLTDLLNKFESYDAGATDVREIVVFSSFLEGDGPTYTAMARIELA